MSTDPSIPQAIGKHAYSLGATLLSVKYDHTVINDNVGGVGVTYSHEFARKSPNSTSAVVVNHAN